MVRVKGQVKYVYNFDMKLNVSEEFFDSLSLHQQDKLIQENLDFDRHCSFHDVGDIEVDEVL